MQLLPPCSPTLFAQQTYKCTLKGPMNGLCILVHVRLLSMGASLI